MELNNKYTPKETEKKWYQHWMDKNYFHSTPDDREAFSVVIPPPNVTGFLHMGHMLNVTIQDVLCRRARAEGKNVCWVPGTDHASIATEAKVVKKLREQGIKKSDIGREAFLKHAFEWKDEYGGIILNQLQLLGASCDWERTRFTMEDSLYKAVIKVFVDLHKKGKIYRGLRMTNWDPVAKTVLSNEEVLYKDENSKLHYVKYLIEGTEDEYVTIATVRPETILGDTAIAVNPNDERFKHLVGKKALVPLINRPIPIIADRYVEVEFGTGCLKVTPAHDMNDYEIGERHNLEVIDVLNDDRTMSETATMYVGMDAYKARKEIVKDLEAAGHIVKIEDYQNKVGRSERTNAVVEPRLTMQWFMQMKEFAATALKAVKDDEVSFVPKQFYNMLNSWLKEENVKDWCISRQLWWGQRIPAYYYQDEIFVAETAEEALAQAIEKTGNADLSIADLSQDEDVLDTWFSSWLWPISVFDGFQNQEELKYYYPTSILVTGWDIMFFWVARMVMSGYEYSTELLGEEHTNKHGKQPFNKVYFTGMVRDKNGKKMSKSLGNSPDALTLIDKYGADGVRFGVLSSAAAGNDIIFDAPFKPKTKQVLNESPKCEQGLHFCNKMWNALRLIKGWEVCDTPENESTTQINAAAFAWMENKLSETVSSVNQKFEQFRLSEIIMDLYQFIWKDYCSWYLEIIKPAYGSPIDAKTKQQAIALFEKALILLHPFMPFVTEEIWSHLGERKEGDDIVLAQKPAENEFNTDIINVFEDIQVLVSQIRDLRNRKGISPKEALALKLEKNSRAEFVLNTHEGIQALISKLANLSQLDWVTENTENSISFVANSLKCELILNESMDTGAELERLEKELEYYKGFVAICQKKLSNERFVNNAPEAVVASEKKKMEDGLSKIETLQSGINKIKG